MKVLCRKYSRYLIAALLMTVLYGKSVAGVIYKAMAVQSMKATSKELPAEDSDNETEAGDTFKACKKCCGEMEPGQVLLPALVLMQTTTAELASVHCTIPQKHFQKVPTPPPLS